MECFNKFAQTSRLQTNKDKSSINFGGISNEEQVHIVQTTGLILGQLLFKYLGIPPSTKKLTLGQWMLMVEKIVAKIITWTARKLSYAGR